MDIQINEAKQFLGSILVNTNHTIGSLSDILAISKKRLLHMHRLSQRDYQKIQELRIMLEQTNCRWLK